MVTAAKGRTGRKRANGDGTVRLRADGLYETRVTVAGGARRSFYGTSHDEVRRKLTEATRTRDQGLPVPVGKQTLGQYLDQWLEEVVKVKNRYRTYESYRGLVRTRITPGLGGN